MDFLSITRFPPHQGPRSPELFPPLSRGFFLPRYLNTPASPLLTIELKVSKRLKIVDRQFDNKRAFVTDPSIAFDAAGNALATVVNLNEPFPATVALHLSDSS
jgi:hypothetical protein